MLGFHTADSPLTPEWIAYSVLDNRYPIVKAKCSSIFMETTPRGDAWVGTYVIPDDVEGPLTPNFVLQEGKIKEDWKRGEKPAVKGDQVRAVWQDSDKPAPKPGDDVVLLYHPKWEVWLALGLTAGQYDVISKSPCDVDFAKKRLLYWLPHRNSKDAVLRAMANVCFLHCSPEVCFASAKEIDLAELRVGFDQATPSERGAFAVMLGVRGDAATDGLRFEETIRQSFTSEELQPNLTWLLIGYLELDPVDAVKLIEGQLQRHPDHYSTIYSTMDALRVTLRWSDSKLPRGEGLRLLHLLLDHPELNNLVVRDLIRLGDWTQSSKLGQLWDQPRENSNQIRRSILMYLLSAEKKGTPSESKIAKEVLSDLRARSLIRDDHERGREVCRNTDRLEGVKHTAAPPLGPSRHNPGTLRNDP